MKLRLLCHSDVTQSIDLLLNGVNEVKDRKIRVENIDDVTSRRDAINSFLYRKSKFHPRRGVNKLRQLSIAGQQRGALGIVFN